MPEDLLRYHHMTLPTLIKTSLLATLLQWAPEPPETITIGTQQWMASNLAVTEFRNGDKLFLAKNARDWKKAAKKKMPACAYVDFDPSTAKIHGMVYNWYAVEDRRGLAPEGWRVPSTTDWKQLISHLGGPRATYRQIADNAVPGLFSSGYVSWVSGSKAEAAQRGYYWSSEGFDSSCTFVGLTMEVDIRNQRVLMDSFGKGNGLLVRCLQNLEQ